MQITQAIEIRHIMQTNKIMYITQIKYQSVHTLYADQAYHAYQAPHLDNSYHADQAELTNHTYHEDHAEFCCSKKL